MDTRKLSLEESAHEHEMELQDQYGQRLGAVWLERPDTATGEEIAFGVELVRRWNDCPKHQARADKAEKAAATLAFRMIEAEHALREALKGLEFAMQRDPDQAGTYDAAATHANLFLQTIKA